MLFQISEERMKKVGELTFTAFAMARQSRRLTTEALVNEGIIPYRQKIYEVYKGKTRDYEYYRAIFTRCLQALPPESRQSLLLKMTTVLLE